MFNVEFHIKKKSEFAETKKGILLLRSPGQGGAKALVTMEDTKEVFPPGQACLTLHVLGMEFCLYKQEVNLYVFFFVFCFLPFHVYEHITIQRPYLIPWLLLVKQSVKLLSVTIDKQLLSKLMFNSIHWPLKSIPLKEV